MKQESSETLIKNVGLFIGLGVFLLLLLLPTPAGLEVEAQRMGAVVSLMAIWWVTEAVPIPVTSMLPIALYPLLHIMPSKTVTPNYTNHLIFLFIGGFLLASAIEKWNLHRRIALNIIRLMGTNPYRLMFGFMAATAFLAMWISNTATAVMMMPIAMAVANQLADNSTYRGDGSAASREIVRMTFGSALMLGIGYSASIGGVGTLIGTPPNIVFAGFIREMYPKAPEIGFLQWMLVGFPLVLIFLPICWIIVSKFSTKIPLKDIEFGVGETNLIEENIKDLGPMNKGERIILIAFALTVFLWMFRAPMNLGIATIPGWSSLLPTGYGKYLHDATVSIFMSIVLFMVPVNFKKREFILDWKTASKGIPWGTVLLFGGGFAIASGFKTTGLDAWLGSGLTGISGLPMMAIIFLVCIFMVSLTTVTSNTATSTMIMPIMAATAVGLGEHPFWLMIPATISASCAFMLPVSTPPNAIVFGSGWIQMRQMLKTGFILNMIGIFLVTFLCYFLMMWVFGLQLGTLPAWVH